jgi:hypothetical protein
MTEDRYYLTEKLTVRFTKEEYDTLREFAKRAGMSVSEVIRWATLGFFIITSESLINIIKPLKEIANEDITNLYEVANNGGSQKAKGSKRGVATRSTEQKQ